MHTHTRSPSAANIAAVVVMLFAAPASHAEYFTYSFSGQVTVVDNPFGFFTAPVVVGAPVSGSFTYTDTPSRPPSTIDEFLTRYTHRGTPADTGMALTIGGATANSIASSLTNMIVGDNNPSDSNPPYFPVGDSFRHGDELSGSSPLFDFPLDALLQYPIGNVFLADSAAAVFGSQALPSGLPLSAFDRRYGVLFIYDDDLEPTGQLEFQIDSIQQVPEPGSLALVLTCCAGAAALRRRRLMRIVEVRTSAAWASCPMV